MAALLGGFLIGFSTSVVPLLRIDESLSDLLMLLAGGCAVLFGALLGIGGFLLKLQLWGWGGLVAAVLGALMLKHHVARAPLEG